MFMKYKNVFKVKIEYENGKLSKKPQIIFGQVIGNIKKLNKKIKIKRKVSNEFIIQTFNLKNTNIIKNITKL